MATIINPVITDWVRLGLRYRTELNPVTKSFIIPAHGQRGMPEEGKVFKCPEGFLSVIVATFDHPKCGIRVIAEPGFDSRDKYVVENIAAGKSKTDPYIYAKAPPDMPPGLYLVARISQAFFQNEMRILAINNDTVEHYCLGYGYQVDMLLEPRKISEIPSRPTFPPAAILR